MHTFTFQGQDPFDKNIVTSKVTIEVHQDSSLDEILQDFKSYLMAVGYTINPSDTLELVEFEEEVSKWKESDA